MDNRIDDIKYMVNQALLELITISKMKIKPHEWTDIPNKVSGWIETKVSLMRISCQGRNCRKRLRLCTSYVFGILIWAFKHLRRQFGSLKPVRVGPSPHLT